MLWAFLLGLLPSVFAQSAFAKVGLAGRWQCEVEEASSVKAMKTKQLVLRIDRNEAYFEREHIKRSQYQSNAIPSIEVYSMQKGRLVVEDKVLHFITHQASVELREGASQSER